MTWLSRKQIPVEDFSDYEKIQEMDGEEIADRILNPAKYLGSKTSPAKAESSRKNGRKGGGVTSGMTKTENGWQYFGCEIDFDRSIERWKVYKTVGGGVYLGEYRKLTGAKQAIEEELGLS